MTTAYTRGCLDRMAVAAARAAGYTAARSAIAWAIVVTEGGARLAVDYPDAQGWVAQTTVRL